MKWWKETKVPWPKALPFVLMISMRMRHRACSNLSPFEILLLSVPPQTGAGPPRPLPSVSLYEDALLTFYLKLSFQLGRVFAQVADAIPRTATGPLHSLQPCDFVLARTLLSPPGHPDRREGPPGSTPPPARRSSLQLLPVKERTLATRVEVELKRSTPLKAARWAGSKDTTMGHFTSPHPGTVGFSSKPSPSP